MTPEQQDGERLPRRWKKWLQHVAVAVFCRMNGILKKAIIDVHKSQGPCRANGGCIVRMQG